MKIESLRSVLIYEIEMDNGDLYQRSANSDSWMKLYAMSWETCSDVEEQKAEKAFQDYVNAI